MSSNEFFIGNIEVVIKNTWKWQEESNTAQ